MNADLALPQWMRHQITAEEYDSWPPQLCAGVEIVDGMVSVSPSPTKRHNRLVRRIANALETAAGDQWNADVDFDVRLQDVPLVNRRPDVTVYRADTIDLSPTRPEHVLMVVEVVSPGSETTDRVVKLEQYAAAGIQFYWIVEQRDGEQTVVYTYTRDAVTGHYGDATVHHGRVLVTDPFAVDVQL